MFNMNTPSLSDIAAVTGNRNNNDDGWGNGSGWWFIIVLFALFGWGRGGFGGNNGDNGNSGKTEVVVVPTGGMGMGNANFGFSEASMQRGFDNQTVINKLDGINAGICSLGYDQLAQMNALNNNITQTGYGLQQSIQQQTITQMQDTNALSRQLGDCCCENRAAIAQVRYDMATQACDTRQTINTAARDIIDNQNANYRALHDEFVAYQLSQKDQTIAEQASLIQALNLSASQSNQNLVIQGYINQAFQAAQDNARNCPYPSYNVPNPNCCYPVQLNGYGFNYQNSGCNCNN